MADKLYIISKITQDLSTGVSSKKLSITRNTLNTIYFDDEKVYKFWCYYSKAINPKFTISTDNNKIYSPQYYKFSSSYYGEDEYTTNVLSTYPNGKELWLDERLREYYGDFGLAYTSNRFDEFKPKAAAISSIKNAIISVPYYTISGTTLKHIDESNNKPFRFLLEYGNYSMTNIKQKYSHPIIVTPYKTIEFSSIQNVNNYTSFGTVYTNTTQDLFDYKSNLIIDNCSQEDIELNKEFIKNSVSTTYEKYLENCKLYNIINENTGIVKFNGNNLSEYFSDEFKIDNNSKLITRREVNGTGANNEGLAYYSVDVNKIIKSYLSKHLTDDIINNYDYIALKIYKQHEDNIWFAGQGDIIIKLDFSNLNGGSLTNVAKETRYHVLSYEISRNNITINTDCYDKDYPINNLFYFTNYTDDYCISFDDNIQINDNGQIIIDFDINYKGEVSFKVFNDTSDSLSGWSDEITFYVDTYHVESWATNNTDYIRIYTNCDNKNILSNTLFRLKGNYDEFIKIKNDYSKISYSDSSIYVVFDIIETGTIEFEIYTYDNEVENHYTWVTKTFYVEKPLPPVTDEPTTDEPTTDDEDIIKFIQRIINAKYLCINDSTIKKLYYKDKCIYENMWKLQDKRQDLDIETLYFSLYLNGVGSLLDGEHQLS